MPSPAEVAVAGRGGARDTAERSTSARPTPAWALVTLPGVIASAASVAVLVLSRDISQRAAAYPQALAVLLLAVGLWSLVSDLATLRGRVRRAEDDRGEGSEYGPLHAGRIAGFTLLTAVAVWLIGPLGFFPAAGIILVGGMLVLGVRSPLRIACYTAAVLGLSYLLFMLVLKLPLPLATGF